MAFPTRAFASHILITITVGCAIGWGQKISGTVAGDITDASGAAVVGARVVAHNQATNSERQAVTNDRGGYVIDLLPAGRYDVSIEHVGFSKRTFTGFEIQVDQDARLDSQLQVGEARQVVSVASSAPLLQTNASSVGSVVEQRQVQNLPLNGRQFLQLALLVPGAVQTPPGSQPARHDIFGGQHQWKS